MRYSVAVWAKMKQETDKSRTGTFPSSLLKFGSKLKRVSNLQGGLIEFSHFMNLAIY